jgi:hypothetical protein
MSLLTCFQGQGQILSIMSELLAAKSNAGSTHVWETLQQRLVEKDEERPVSPAEQHTAI